MYLFVCANWVLHSINALYPMHSASFYSSSNVIVTDLPELVPLMDMNITENNAVLQGRASAKPLPWQVR